MKTRHAIIIGALLLAGITGESLAEEKPKEPRLAEEKVCELAGDKDAQQSAESLVGKLFGEDIGKWSSGAMKLYDDMVCDDDTAPKTPKEEESADEITRAKGDRSASTLI